MTAPDVAMPHLESIVRPVETESSNKVASASLSNGVDSAEHDESKGQSVPNVEEETLAENENKESCDDATPSKSLSDTSSQVSSRRNAKLICCECDEAVAELECASCMDVFCRACSDSFHSKGRRKDHVCLEISDNHSMYSSIGAIPPSCADHPSERKTLLCVYCEEPVCAICIMRGLHKGHEAVPLQESVSRLRDGLAAHLASLEPIFSSSRNSAMSVQHQITALERELQISRRSVQDAFQSIQDVLQTKEQALQQQLEHYHQEKATILTLALEKADYRLKDLTTLRDDIKQALGQSSVFTLAEACRNVSTYLAVDHSAENQIIAAADGISPDIALDLDTSTLFGTLESLQWNDTSKPVEVKATPSVQVAQSQQQSTSPVSPISPISPVESPPVQARKEAEPETLGTPSREFHMGVPSPAPHGNATHHTGTTPRQPPTFASPSAASPLSSVPLNLPVSGNPEKWEHYQSTAVLKGHQSCVNSLCLLPHKNMLISASDDRTLRMWDLHSMQSTMLSPSHGSIFAVCAVGNGAGFAAGFGDRTILLWNNKMEKYDAPCASWDHHDGSVFALVSVTPHLMASASYDRTIRLWQLPDDLWSQEAAGIVEPQCTTLTGHAGSVRALAAVTSHFIASAAYDRSVRWWDVTSQSLITTWNGHARYVNCIASLSDSVVVSGSDDRTIRMWDSRSSGCIAEWRGHAGAVSALTVTADGDVLSGGSDRAIRVWDPRTGSTRAALNGHQRSVFALAFEEKRSTLYSGAYDDTVICWQQR
jgi:WD40 repeat protein